MTIPSNVVSIGPGAFENCSTLMNVYCKAIVPPSAIVSDSYWNAFDNNALERKIYVPNEALAIYRSAEEWNSYAKDILPETSDLIVDLGLSIKWSSCNLGATSPEEMGDYFAWGEIKTKTFYDSSNSTWWNVKYANLPLNSEGNIQSSYDAATSEWGNSWRLPTKAELDELINNCNWTWNTLNGVIGYTITSKINGNSIFLPSNDSYVVDGKETGFGSYWSSTPCNDITFDTYGRYAGAIGFYAKDYNISDDVRIQSIYFLRWCKRGIRPVYNE